MTKNRRYRLGFAAVLIVVAACEYTMHVRPATKHEAAPAPQFTIEYDKRRDRGKLESIQVYDVSTNKPTLTWKAVSTSRRRAKGIYRFTYGVAPLGMKNKGEQKPMNPNRTYEVCIESRHIECHRFGVGVDGLVKRVERPPEAYDMIPDWAK